VSERWHPAEAFDFLATRRGVTTSSLSKASGYDRMLITRIRRGLKAPSLVEAVKLTIHLNALCGAEYGVDDYFELTPPKSVRKPAIIDTGGEGLEAIPGLMYGMPPFTYIGARLDYVMTLHDLANNAVARVAKIDHATVSRVRRGVMNISKGKAKQITQAVSQIIGHETPHDILFPIDQLRERTPPTSKFKTDVKGRREQRAKNEC